MRRILQKCGKDKITVRQKIAGLQRVVMQIQPKTVQGKTRMEKLEVGKATFSNQDSVN